MANKSTVMILLVIIAVLALSLAVSIGYIFTVSDSSQGGSVPASEINVPGINEVSSRYLFKEDKYFNLKQGDEGKLSVIRVGIELVYYKKVKGVRNVEQVLDAYDGAIKEMVGTYFLNMTLEEAKLEETKIASKEYLKNKINELLNRGKKERDKADIIYTINFSEWLYQ